MRTLIFKTYFYLGLAIWVILMMPLLLQSSPKPLFAGLRRFVRSVYWMLDHVVGIKVEFHGLENLPTDTAYVFSPKHQSTLDGVSVFAMLPDFTALVKKELGRVPLFGSILKRLGLYFIDRHSGDAHEEVPNIVRKVIEDRLPLIVFPEGTRVHEDTDVKLRSGSFHIQEDAEIPVITVATNSGYFWPVEQFTMRPGIAIFEIHPAMPKGMSKEEFMAELKRRIIDRSAELKQEAVELGQE